MTLPDDKWETELADVVQEMASEIDIPEACAHLARLIDQANDRCCGCGWAGMMAAALEKVRPEARARPS
jgi:hypothetical protein